MPAITGLAEAENGALLYSRSSPMVQQIGRVLRNPVRSVSKPAFVLDYSDGEQQSLWDNFLEYEALVDKNGIECLDLSGRLLESLKDALSELIYHRRQAPLRSPACPRRDEALVFRVGDGVAADPNRAGRAFAALPLRPASRACGAGRPACRGGCRGGCRTGGNRGS